MTLTVTYDVCGDTATVVHSAPRVTYRLRSSGVATVREYAGDTLLRSVSYRSAWIINRIEGETS
mgnify:FL=1